MTAAQLLVKCLENEGVEYIFGIPGEENIDIMDALSTARSSSSPRATSKAPRSWPTSMGG